jgi:hypothetical protein
VRCLELKHLYECLCRTERQALSGGITARAGRLTFQRRRLHAEVRESRVEDPLLERDGGPGVGDGIRMVQRGNREIRGGEPPLREQRAEDEDRLIAALHGLGHVDPRPESRLRSLDTRVRFVDRRRERPCVGGFALCASDCVLERQGRLCQRWSHPHHQHAEQQGERV